MHKESSSLRATETVSSASATAPRVKLEDIKNAIDRVYYTTADRAVAHELTRSIEEDPLKLLTLCIIVMKNGFVVIGKSAPASPENFDKAKGELFAYEDAIRQLWPLMGFALRDILHATHNQKVAG